MSTECPCSCPCSPALAISHTPILWCTIVSSPRYALHPPRPPCAPPLLSPLTSSSAPPHQHVYASTCSSAETDEPPSTASVSAFGDRSPLGDALLVGAAARPSRWPMDILLPVRCFG
mmetsp:Transcript_47418/g.94624  ORF Transcript_47418/g.94624 Transcript_47418/m.94624 type:complete len:117 (-) Transcript_47418:1098-1448(-)